MPQARDVLVLVHGMTPERGPVSHAGQYRRFLDGLDGHVHGLLPPHGSIDRVLEVEWGHEAPGSEPSRDDEFLTRAQRFVSDRVRDRAVRRDRSPHSFRRFDPGVPGLRWLARFLREGIVQFGLADALYYAAPDGEEAVRRAIYTQVLEKLEECRGADVVRLHVVAHSLGVAVMHDFLYGLFTARAPDFIEQAEGDWGRCYRDWGARAGRGGLLLGTFVSMASQLPLFVMRKQALVERLAAGKLLDPAVIGVTARDRTQWLVFYDADDVLGFATRRLYLPVEAIRDVQVNSGWNPASAHTGYWEDETVLRETARLLSVNTANTAERDGRAVG